MTLTQQQCAKCGNATIVDGACASCGAGVSYRLPHHRGPKKRKPHAHAWGFEGVTFETGTKGRKERCTRKNCPARRVTEVE